MALSSSPGFDVAVDQGSSTGHSDWHGPHGDMPSNTSMLPDGSPYPWHQYGLWWYQESQSTNQTLAAIGPWGFCFLSLLFQQDKKHSVTCNFHSWLLLATSSLALLQWRNMVSSLNIGQFCGRFNYQIIRKWFCARLSAKKLRDGQLPFLISGILALMKITIPKQNYSQNTPCCDKNHSTIWSWPHGKKNV